MGTERRFNPLAKFAMVHPPYRGAVRLQDGGYFDPDGKLLWEDHPPTPPKKVVSEVIITDGLTGESTVETVENEVEDIKEGDPKEILKLWLTGQIALHHTKVRVLTTKGYSVTLGTRDEIVDFLVNEAHLVAAEQVNIKAPPSAADAKTEPPPAPPAIT